MAEIHELSEILANQIAAGEVIERPGSVVKELVENALDAHATQIDVLVEEAGVKSIRVIDNGDGIPGNQVARAFLRHATSKINSRQDLFRVQSLGFRGEALPSIASVADVVLQTATADAEQGAKIHYQGGKIIEETGTNARQGTDITVSDLFFNTPARLKYLKSQATELSQIVDVINRLAMSYPNVAFHLVHNGKELLQTAGNGNLQQVIASVYGVQQARKMLSVSAHDNDFEINGFISLPELTRANRSYISILINGRFVKNYNLSKAIVKGYGSKLMVGRFPIAILQIKMDPLLVDVNVHPQKHEVRLSKETQLMSLIEEMVVQRFVNENLIPNAYENYMQGNHDSYVVPEHDNDQFMTQLQEASVTFHQETGRSLQNISSDEIEIPEIPIANDPDLSTTQTQNDEVVPIVITKSQDLVKKSVRDFVAKYTAETPSLPFTEAADPVAAEEVSLSFTNTDLVDDSRHDKPFPDLQYIGQMHGTFLFAQSPEGFYIVDQHAAQERIKYEYYREEIGKVGLESQKLLVPIVLTYPKIDILKIQAHASQLEQVGLNLESFGDDAVIVREHPAWIEKGQEEATIREMVDWLLRDGNITTKDFREKTAIMMSCKRSIKANWALNDYEARGLLKQLAQAQNPYNCPHGRPVLVSFTNTDMEKMFKRIQDSHESWVEYDNHPF
ncbi:DNA mismatch repair endonuclease MutL [Weissella paramesenteroides]|nr:DNA mismatch repair endonuclease MutL [Weissella paramesenteroides]ATF40788.1 DNA mismatch repair endonuclease MutL [Weissella paramesenteroides]KAA8445537.1 DNA mismatch repair endonuclease MutL [Weissella paramesenteroides]KAA8451038.1 DNA mismatch repair endonuclease MutL [Weissella paramesenteroides]KAA8455114.1 DNA mismatch repair endonuclease MutL [Weissella paramesenteroides]KAA8457704.1 DNA mismatch repair endonuclease MutL [Weissella paramesenteroides]